MKKYLVGGAVRDKLLNLPVKDKDYVVVGLTHEDMVERGFVMTGKSFAVYRDSNGDEHALARKEVKTSSGHTGFNATYENVSLEEDLARRDLTINAMAYDEQTKQTIDPYGGCHDLANRILRHTSPAFSEDPLRVLRVARFAARYHDLGFTIADETMSLMATLSESGELDSLSGNRIWTELEKTLSDPHPEVFIRTLHECGALAKILPEVDRLFGIPQPPAHHPEGDVGTHSLLCMQVASRCGYSKEVIFAALIHDIGKALTPKDKYPKHHNHEVLGLDALDAIKVRLPLPNSYLDVAKIGVRYHGIAHSAFELRPNTLLKTMLGIDCIRKPSNMTALIQVASCDANGRGLPYASYEQGSYLEKALKSLSKINSKEEISKGPNPAEAIYRARLKVLSQYVNSHNNQVGLQHGFG